jgi:RIO-like serine/threonine protein kinase
VADLLRKELGAEVHLVHGSFQEFTVLVEEETVARKKWFRFPNDQTLLEEVRRTLERTEGEGRKTEDGGNEGS